MEKKTRTIYDIIDTCDGEVMNRISLTDDQIRLLEWLEENGYLVDGYNYNQTDKIEIMEI